MLDICATYCSKFCLDFNTKKSQVMIVGDDLKEGVFSPLFLNGESLKYVCIYRYLGVNLLAKKHLTFPAHADICSFYRAANSILYCSSSYSNYPDEHVLMKLLYANCVPILSYA